MRKLVLFFVLCGVSAVQADMTFSNVSGGGTAPGEATVTATVAGSGRVYAEYAHDKKAPQVRSVKDRYVQNGLLAMWDAVDNMGTGAHDPSATTWRDLVGNHPDMTFTAPPTVGANFYDLSDGGCGVLAPDIAEALQSGAATVEIVCKVRTLVNDSTLVACVDGTDTETGAAGNRILWVRHQDNVSGKGVIGAIEYRRSAYKHSLLVDKVTNEMRSYAFLIDGQQGCVVASNGVWAVTEDQDGKVNANTANGWFSIGQRICKAGTSAATSDLLVYSVRVYDHYLTNPERLANYAVDRERFFDAPEPLDLDSPGRSVTKESAFVGTVTDPVTNAKDFYATDGLIAMWDGEDNRGTGAHDPSATTWVDLTGTHAAMTFDTAPTVGTTYYDVSQGGGCIKSCVDIAQAIQAKNATIEIVCDVRSLVDSGTLVSLVDGAGEAAGNRLVWVMNGKLETNHQGAVGTLDYLTSESSFPYPSYDLELNKVRSYSLKFNDAQCSVYRNGSATPGTSKDVGKSGTITLGDAQTACFSIGQRYSQGGKSGTISDMKVYCVRVYNRQLSADEIAANHVVDQRRFFGAKNEQPLGSFMVKNPDGTTTVCTDAAVFKLSGLRADIVPYTVRLTAEGGASPSPRAVIETAAERPTSTWYESLDSRYTSSNRLEGPTFDLEYVSNGHVPVVETRYQILGGNGHGVFGNNGVAAGTMVMQLEHDGVPCLRYRVGDGTKGGYEPLTGDELGGVHKLVFNSAEGTILNDRPLDGDLAGMTDTSTLTWLLFGRFIDSGSSRYIEFAKVRIWNFKLWSDGEQLYDLVPACQPDGKAGMFNRLSNTYLRNAGTGTPFTHGPARPAMELEKPRFEGASFTVTLKRTGTAASDVYVAYGPTHGGADRSAWAHFERLATGFAADQAALAVTLPGIDETSFKYLRFYSVADGWSDSAYAPDTKRRLGLEVILR